MKYCANKPCKFASNNYLIGDVIPSEVLVPSRIEALKSAGIIAEVPAEVFVNGEAVQPQTDIVKFELPIIEDKNTGEGTDVEFSNVELKFVFLILQEQADKAAGHINDIDSENVLIAVKALESRKTVKSAAEKRLAELYSNKGDA